jgi:hypothetical protein
VVEDRLPGDADLGGDLVEPQTGDAVLAQLAGADREDLLLGLFRCTALPGASGGHLLVLSTSGLTSLLQPGTYLHVSS